MDTQTQQRPDTYLKGVKQVSEYELWVHRLNIARDGLIEWTNTKEVMDFYKDKKEWAEPNIVADSKAGELKKVGGGVIQYSNGEFMTEKEILSNLEKQRRIVNLCEAGVERTKPSFYLLRKLLHL